MQSVATVLVEDFILVPLLVSLLFFILTRVLRLVAPQLVYDVHSELRVTDDV